VWRGSAHAVLLAVFACACLSEGAQVFSVADRLGFARGGLMHTVIGNTFSWGDIGCHAVGCVLAAALRSPEYAHVAR